jgi:hypothetical protein
LLVQPFFASRRVKRSRAAGLAAIAPDPIRAGDYRCQLLLQDNNSVKTN